MNTFDCGVTARMHVSLKDRADIPGSFEHGADRGSVLDTVGIGFVVEYLMDEDDGVTVAGFCQIVGEPCGFLRRDKGLCPVEITGVVGCEIGVETGVEHDEMPALRIE